jgi:hypothetical protein
MNRETITCVIQNHFHVKKKRHVVKGPEKINSIERNNQFGIYKTRLGKTCLEGMTNETSAYYNNKLEIITLRKTAIELNLQ